MKVFSAFDGIGVGRLALHLVNLPVTTYYASEIDQTAIKICKKNHPDVVQVGNIKGVKGASFPKIDLLLGGSPCFVAGTQVITDKGYKNIEDIGVGDNVLTHKNRFKKVIRVGGKTNQRLLEVQAQGMLPTKVTKEHPYYVREKSVKNNRRVFSDPKWVAAEDLTKNHHIAVPILSTVKDSLTYEECYLLGRYLADGHAVVTKRKGRKNSFSYKFCISIGKHEFKQFKEDWGDKFSYIEERTAYKCFIYQKRWTDLAEKFGKYAHGKYIPSFVLDLPVLKLREFLDGYFDGDGSYRNGVYRATTVSRKLAMSLCLAISKAYKVNANIEFTKRPSTCVIEGRVVNQRDTYTVSFREEMKKQSNAVVDQDFVWLPVKKVNCLLEKQNVFNLEVEDDNSYTANNVVVHNCQGFSHAGAQLNFSDPRSALFFHFVRLIEEMQPKYFLLENVVMKEEWHEMISRFLQVKPFLINSTCFSAQNRPRLYWTNIPNIKLPDTIHPVSFDDIAQMPGHVCAMRGRRINSEGKRDDYNYSLPIIQQIECRTDHKTNCLTTVDKDNVICDDWHERTPADKVNYRYLTPLECERLQTLPDDYTKLEDVPDYKRKHLLGNAWTSDVIAYILNFLHNV